MYLIPRLRRSMVELSAFSGQRLDTIKFDPDGLVEPSATTTAHRVCKVLLRSSNTLLSNRRSTSALYTLAEFEVIGQLVPNSAHFTRTTRYPGPYEVPVTKFEFSLQRRPQLASRVQWERIERALLAIASKVPGAVVTTLYDRAEERGAGQLVLTGEHVHLDKGLYFPVDRTEVEAENVDDAHIQRITNVPLRAVFMIRSRRRSVNGDSAHHVVELYADLVRLSHV
ncbi:hypothetical protein PsYK624_165200 [Phanerochaete sordida]|uniref:Uncharacterized protein n=1 Tax=Phanerochaete sordida TaxID=48140 RepID=A0A9P3LN42_9APHY|nr:hypothetical protein PsYK624_165200 [Phanerochaete sordida]